MLRRTRFQSHRFPGTRFSCIFNGAEEREWEDQLREFLTLLDPFFLVWGGFPTNRPHLRNYVCIFELSFVSSVSELNRNFNSDDVMDFRVINSDAIWSDYFETITASSDYPDSEYSNRYDMEYRVSPEFPVYIESDDEFFSDDD